MDNNEFMMKCTDCANIRNLRTARQSTDYYRMQSICYIQSENALVICYTKITPNDTRVRIEKINYNTLILLSI